MDCNKKSIGKKLHIGIFGKRNTGKSSILNAMAKEELVKISTEMNHSTEPVFQTLELEPFGSIVMIDTPGLNEEGEIGQIQIQKSFEVLEYTDIAILVLDGADWAAEIDRRLVRRFREYKIPFVVAVNKSDILSKEESFQKGKDLSKSLELTEEEKENSFIMLSATNGEHLLELQEMLMKKTEGQRRGTSIFHEKIKVGDLVLLLVSEYGTEELERNQNLRKCLAADILEEGGRVLTLNSQDFFDHYKQDSVLQLGRYVVCGSQELEQVQEILAGGPVIQTVTYSKMENLYQEQD